MTVTQYGALAGLTVYAVPQVLAAAAPDFTPILKNIGALTSVSDFVGELDKEHHFVKSTV
jgi:multiple sugar transport system substrate-binding protein